MQDFGANALADISNIALHFVHPWTNHDHSCLCLLCAAQEKETQRNRKKKSQSQSLITLPTSTDLDLIKTGSKSIRQVVVYDQNPSFDLRQLIVQLQTYIGFKVNFNIPPNVEASFEAAFHVLVIIANEGLSDGAKAWLKQIFDHNLAKRVILLCNLSDRSFVAKYETNPKFTCIYHKQFESMLKGVVHGMMVTKQRLMPKDLCRFLSSDCAEIHTSQQGACLFF